MKHLFNVNTKVCRVCGQCVNEGKITTDCTGGVIKLELLKLVQEGKLDYRDGDWTDIKPTPNELFITFMNAMDEELSPEASDELTDEDIDLLKSINSVPLPRRMVRDLELPIELMVSLHKLKRLDYVRSYNESNTYQVTDKGEEFLKPKPVQLDIHALQLMVLMYKQESLRTPTGKGALHTLNWLNGNTGFIHPDCNNKDHWTLSPLGKEFIDGILNKQLLFI